MRSRAAADGAELHAGESAADDLRTIAPHRRERAGPLVVAYADVVTQREVLAGLLQEPRIRTGILTTGGPVARPYGFKTRASRGRIVRRGSPYHAVRKPTGTFLGVIKVAPADRPGVAPVAQRLAALVDPPAADWREELDYKAGHWRRMLALFSLDRERGAPAPPTRGARRRRRSRPRTPPSSSAGARSRRDDVTALLLVGLVRSSVHITASRPALAVLGPPRLAGRARSAPRPTSSSTTRTASCSTRRSRDRTASSPRSSSRPTRATSRAGRRGAG